jgi:tetratricopeptide (TPR) repeat protein
MNSIRIAQLQQFQQDDPHDPFPVYGLALEYLRTDAKKSEAYFDALLTRFPDYLPTYYHAAKLKADFNKTDEAIEVYKRGIELAKKLDDNTTWRELKSALEELTF